MKILKRASDIMAANINDLVDRFEQPERMLRYSLREIETLVETTAVCVARSIAAERIVARTRDEQAARVETWQARAIAALNTGDDDRARRAVAMKLDAERSLAATESQLASARTANAALRRQAASLRQKHAEAQADLALLTARHAAAMASRQVLAVTNHSLGQFQALNRFERFRRAVELAEAESTALIELDLATTDWDPEFEQDNRDQAINDELARLRPTPSSSHP